MLVRGQRNIHWNPQTHFCGFFKYWWKFNFIGSFEHLAEHGRMLFDRVSPTFWEEYCARGWSLTQIPLQERNIHEYMRYAPENFNVSDCMFCKNYAFHKSSYSNTAVMTRTEWEQILSTYTLDEQQLRAVFAQKGPALDTQFAWHFMEAKNLSGTAQ